MSIPLPFVSEKTLSKASGKVFTNTEICYFTPVFMSLILNILEILTGYTENGLQMGEDKKVSLNCVTFP